MFIHRSSAVRNALRKLDQGLMNDRIGIDAAAKVLVTENYAGKTLDFVSLYVKT
jgi:hypothetical protein